MSDTRCPDVPLAEYAAPDGEHRWGYCFDRNHRNDPCTLCGERIFAHRTPVVRLKTGEHYHSACLLSVALHEAEAPAHTRPVPEHVGRLSAVVSAQAATMRAVLALGRRLSRLESRHADAGMTPPAMKEPTT